jgi:leucyl aminopeptidase
MIVNIFTDPLSKLKASALIVPVPMGGDLILPKELTGYFSASAIAAFAGKLGETLVVFPVTGSIERIVLVGLGDGKTDVDKMEVFRRALGSAVKQLVGQQVTEVAIYLGGIFKSEYIHEAVLISLIAPYKYQEHRSGKQDLIDIASLTLVAPGEKTSLQIQQVLEDACAMADSVRVARDLVNAPSNVMTPTALAKAAKKLAESTETLSCKVLGQKLLEADGFGGILAVARGSQAEPQLITLEYQPKQAKSQKTIVLVGKGVTFDSGGINLKPERGMNEMHMDMAGGAAVLATLHLVAALKLPLHVVGIVPAVENMPSGTAIKPGDIITSKSGLTIEVANTDAEGRIVLSDALTHAATFKPDLIIDCATLTGAALVALGEERAAVIGNNQVLINDILDAGDETGELLWQLPLDDDYREHVKSETADVKNLGKRGNAGVIAGAAFIEKFIPKDTPWAHIDLAGPAMRSEAGAYQPKGGTGWGVRLLTRILKAVTMNAL